MVRQQLGAEVKMEMAMAGFTGRNDGLYRSLRFTSYEIMLFIGFCMIICKLLLFKFMRLRGARCVAWR